MAERVAGRRAMTRVSATVAARPGRAAPRVPA
jgi:hypothetical protein